MKIYISADIEGITGVTHWNETEKNHEDFRDFSKQMTAEVAAACKGALNANVEEIWVGDAHETGRNIIASELPPEAVLIRGLSGHPFCMLQGIDESFVAVLMVGYHSSGGSNGNPLAHTLTTKIQQIKINDQVASEFILHAYAAELMEIPVVFVSGDAGLCEEANALIPSIVTVGVKRGIGDSTVNLHPHHAVDKIREGVQRALASEIDGCRISMPNHFSVSIKYREHSLAYKNSFYPGARLSEPHVINYDSDDYMQVLTMLSFVS